MCRVLRQALPPSRLRTEKQLVQKWRLPQWKPATDLKNDTFTWSIIECNFDFVLKSIIYGVEHKMEFKYRQSCYDAVHFGPMSTKWCAHSLGCIELIAMQFAFVSFSTNTSSMAVCPQYETAQMYSAFCISLNHRDWKWTEIRNSNGINKFTFV